MSHRDGKILLNNILDVFNALLLSALLVFVVRLITVAHNQAAQTAAVVQKSEREQINILGCWILLFNNPPVTQARLQGCLKGTSLAPSPSPTSQTAPSTTGVALTTTTSSSSGSSPATQPILARPTPNTQQPTASQPTTSAPPPNPNPSSPQPSPPPPAPNPQPPAPASILQQLINPLLPVVNIVQGLVNNLKVL